MKSFDLGGKGPPLHFLHANGYPPECYKPLLELLKTEYRVFGMLLRPLWDDAKPEDIEDWHPLSDDLLRFLSPTAPPALRSTEPVIGVGHSLGAIVTLRASLSAPEKFRALVLLDPVLFVPSLLAFWNFTRTIGLGDKVHPLVVGAEKRRRTFDDLETVFRGYRKRKIFRYMSDDNLRMYIEGITKPSENGGYKLVYPPEWEAQLYRTWLRDSDLWRGLRNLKVPTLIIRGKETNTFLENAASLVRKKQPRVKIESLENSTHILPLERPKEVFGIMQSFLKEVL